MPRHVAIVAGEESGDLLGAALMAALRAREPGMAFTGVGGRHMAGEGLNGIFPLDEVAVMGLTGILANLRPLLRRIREAADAIVEARPDALVIIDSPEFTHRVARRVRKALPGLPVVNYSPPTVWAWRHGRARAMTAYVDRCAALLPFEPAAFERLGGPPCSYVGHPMVEVARRELAGPLPPEPGDAEPVVVVLPGSRRSETGRLLEPFRGTVARLKAEGHGFRVAMPVVHHLREEVARAVADWPVPVELVEGEAEKWAAFRRARAALAASGSVTLQLALVDTPMVGGYRLDPVIRRLMPLLLRIFPQRSVVMANLILDENVAPEFIDDACVPDRLAPALGAILQDGETRRRQLEGFAEIRRRMQMEGAPPSERAAQIVLEAMAAK